MKICALTHYIETKIRQCLYLFFLFVCFFLDQLFDSLQNVYTVPESECVLMVIHSTMTRATESFTTHNLIHTNLCLCLCFFLFFWHEPRVDWMLFAGVALAWAEPKQWIERRMILICLCLMKDETKSIDSICFFSRTCTHFYCLESISLARCQLKKQKSGFLFETDIKKKKLK